MEALPGNRRDVVHRQHFECRPRVRNRSERLRGRHEAPEVQGRHLRQDLAARDSAQDIDDGVASGLEYRFLTLGDRNSLLKRPQERGEVSGARHVEGAQLLESQASSWQTWTKQSSMRRGRSNAMTCGDERALRNHF